MAKNVEFLNNNSIANIDNNFARVKTALLDVVGRSGDLPNQMDADLDMNSNDILNVGLIDAMDLTIGGEPIVDAISQFVEQAESFANLSKDWAIKIGGTVDGSEFSSKHYAQSSETSAGVAEANKNIAQEVALEAFELVQEAVSGFVGFTDGLGYDFGSIISPITYFNQDWGTLA